MVEVILWFEKKKNGLNESSFISHFIECCATCMYYFTSVDSKKSKQLSFSLD